MWILPSRARPHNLQRLLQAYIDTGASSPVWLRIDKNDAMAGAYIVNHPRWTVTIGEQKPLSDVYNEAFQRFHDAPYFGFIADDVIPRTYGWDRQLIDIAGNDGMAAPSGGHGDYSGAPHFVLGGDLVRSIGWLALPGLDRIYIDTVWNDIAAAKGVLRPVPDVILEHWHFSTGRAVVDSTYRKHHKVEDKAIYENWKRRGYTKLKGETHGDPP